MHPIGTLSQTPRRSPSAEPEPPWCGAPSFNSKAPALEALAVYSSPWSLGRRPSVLCTQVLRTSFNSLCANTRLNSFGTSLGGRRPSFYSLWASLVRSTRLYVLNGLVLRTSFYSLYFALILIFWRLFLYLPFILIFWRLFLYFPFILRRVVLLACLYCVRGRSQDFRKGTYG